MSTANESAPKSVSLYYRNGGSDKEYRAYLAEAPSGDGFVVNFTYVL